MSKNIIFKSRNYSIESHDNGRKIIFSRKSWFRKPRSIWLIGGYATIFNRKIGELVSANTGLRKKDFLDYLWHDTFDNIFGTI